MKRLHSVQLLRGVAALAIVVLHCLMESRHVATQLQPGWVGPSVQILGAGVDLFFIISGFVITFVSDRGDRTPPPAGFMASRLLRIVPLYWIATLLLLLAIGVNPGAVNQGVPDGNDIFKSLFFIPYLNDAGEYRPIHKLGWSLNYEMFFYVVFALLIGFGVTRALRIASIGFVALVAAGLFIPEVRENTLLGFYSDPMILEFVAGAHLALAYRRGFRLGNAAALLFFAIGLVSIGVQAWLGFEATQADRVLYWGLPALFLFVGLVLSKNDNLLPAPLLGLSEAVAYASYALYLFHPFFVRLLRGLWTKHHYDAGFGIQVFLYSSLVIVSSVVFSWLIQRAVDMTISARVGAWINAKSWSHAGPAAANRP